MPNSITGRARTHIIEWYIFRCGSENGDYKDIYLKEMGMHVQNMKTILGSVINIIGGPRGPFNEVNHLHFGDE